MMTASVVVVGNADRAPWRRCLEALAAQVGPDAEVIVATGGAPLTAAMIEREFPQIRLISKARPKPLQELRAAGLATAAGKVIALLDCFSIVEPAWLAALLAAHERLSHPAIGGAVDLADAEQANLTSWALYINEYGMFMPPFKPCEMPLLPGCNLSYKREALFADDQPGPSEFWKTFVNEDLRGESSLWVESGAVVRLDKPIPLSHYWLTRFDHGRCYGGMRRTGMGAKERALRVAATPILPLVLVTRWSRRYWARDRRRSKLVLTLPLQMLLFGSWAVGEAIGYIFGSGGACRKLFY